MKQEWLSYMQSLLQEFIREIISRAIMVERTAAPGEKTRVTRADVDANVGGPPSSLSDLAKLLRAAAGDISVKPSKVAGALVWSGTLEDLKNTVNNVTRTAKISLVKDKEGDVKRDDDKKRVVPYTGKKGAFLAYISLQQPIDVGKNMISTVTMVLKPDLTLVDPKQCEEKLKSGSILGYGAEHAIFSALAGTTPRGMIKQMTTQDERLISLLNAAETIAPEALEQYFDKVTTMRAGIVARKDAEFKGVAADIDNPPGGGSSEYDIIAYATNRAGNRVESRKVVIHAKYDDNRLVGIPQAKGSEEKTKKKVADALADDVIVPPSASNIYKDVRDELLFGGPKGPAAALNGNILRDEGLTPYGKRVLRIQKDVRDPEAEINVMMKDLSLRSKLLKMLSERGFLETLNADIKRQLGLDIKLAKGETFKDMLSIFVNIQKDLTPHILKFKSGQGKSWNLEITPTPIESSTAANAFGIAAVSADGSVVIPSVMRVELGSIKRAKYVQVHKGDLARFEEWISSMGSGS